MGFTLQGLGPFLHWMALGVLCVMPVLAGYVIYKLGSLPGSIARSRGHPQADAINICGWMAALYPERAQQDVWGDNPDACIAGVLTPSATATPDDGGMVLNGRWMFDFASSDICSRSTSFLREVT